MAFASDVPVKVGVVSAVTLSVFDVPVSLAAVKSGVPGAAGAALSVVTVSATEGEPVAPAGCVAVAVIKFAALSVSAVVVVTLHTPEPLVVLVPISDPSSRTLIVVPASAVPVNVRPLSVCVMLSVLLLPVSLPDARSGADGAVAGSAESTVPNGMTETRRAAASASAAAAPQFERPERREVTVMLRILPLAARPTVTLRPGLHIFEQRAARALTREFSHEDDYNGVKVSQVPRQDMQTSYRLIDQRYTGLVLLAYSGVDPTMARQ